MLADQLRSGLDSLNYQRAKKPRHDGIAWYARPSPLFVRRERRRGEKYALLMHKVG